MPAFTLRCFDVAFLLGTIIAGVGGCRSYFPSANTAIQFRPGLSIAAVTKQVGRPPAHQFTIAADNGDRAGELICASYTFQKPVVQLFLVFRDGRLEKVIDPDHLNRDHTTPEHGMEAVLSAHGLSACELRSYIDKNRSEQDDFDKRHDLHLGALAVLMLVYWAFEAHDDATYRNAVRTPLERYDGWNIELRTDRARIDATLGPPWKSITEDSVLGPVRTCVYGQFVPLKGRDGNPMYVAIVVVFQNDRVMRVFSRGFVDRDLLGHDPALMVSD